MEVEGDHLEPRAFVGQWHLNDAVEASRAAQRGIDRLQVVRRRNDKYIIAKTEISFEDTLAMGNTNVEVRPSRHVSSCETVAWFELLRPPRLFLVPMESSSSMKMTTLTKLAIIRSNENGERQRGYFLGGSLTPFKPAKKFSLQEYLHISSADSNKLRTRWALKTIFYSSTKETPRGESVDWRTLFQRTPRRTERQQRRGSPRRSFLRSSAQNMSYLFQEDRIIEFYGIRAKGIRE